MTDKLEILELFNKVTKPYSPTAKLTVSFKEQLERFAHELAAAYAKGMEDARARVELDMEQLKAILKEQARPNDGLIAKLDHITGVLEQMQQDDVQLKSLERQVLNKLLTELNR